MKAKIILLLIFILSSISLSAQRRNHHPRVKVKAQVVAETTNEVRIQLPTISANELVLADETDLSELNEIVPACNDRMIEGLDDKMLETSTNQIKQVVMKTQDSFFIKKRITPMGSLKGGKKNRGVFSGIYKVLFIVFAALLPIGMTFFILGITGAVSILIVQTLISMGAAFMGIGFLGAIVVAIVALANYIFTCGYQNSYEM